MHMGMHISIIMLLLTKRFMLLSPFLCFLMWAYYTHALHLSTWFFRFCHFF